MYRDLIVKAAPVLRKTKYQLIGLGGRAGIAARSMMPRSAKGAMVVLSLGRGKGAPYLPRAVYEQGYDLYVVSTKFPQLESLYTKKWIECDPFGDYDTLKEAVARVNPIAVLVDQRNVLLPIKARLNKDLNLVDHGELSHKTSNSKIELRMAVDAAGIPNVPWCLLEDYKPENFSFPFVIKPETGTGSKGITIVENESDFEIAREKLKQLESDETVGGRVLIEQMIYGRQFDVEGVYLNGKCIPLSVTEEQYDAINKSLPSAWYLFSPPVGEALTAKIIDAAREFTTALGVKNGAFHCEMRLNEQGELFVIDYSNRMGYALLVSECCGHSFPGAYVKVMAGTDPGLQNVHTNSVFQRFVRSEEELKRFKTLMKENPHAVVQKNMLGSHVAGIKTYARIALRAEDFPSMLSLLQKYDLVPTQWADYYNL